MHSASSTSAPGPLLTRRRALVRGGQGLVALAVLGAALPACGSDQASGPDPLTAELAAARSDAELAAAAAQATPELAAALLVIADERARHAAALVEELARAAGEPIPEPTTPSDPPSPPPPTPSVRQVSEALRRSGDSAAKLAPTLSGYRAGLLGSIAAACTAAHTVGLPR